MRRSTPMILLALLTAVVPGCNCLNDLDRYRFEGDDDMGPTDQGPDLGEEDAGNQDGASEDAGNEDAGPLTECTGLAAPLDYRVESLVIPASTDVVGGAALGHDVDGTGSACGVPDFADNVDNSFMNLAEALPALSPTQPVRFQADIDRGLSCPENTPLCMAPRWTVRVERGTGCAQITILHGSSAAVLAGPFLASVDGSGNVRGEFDTLDFEIAHHRPNRVSYSVPFVVRDGIFTAHMSELELSDIVIGGSLLQSEVEATFGLVADELSDGSISYSEISPILEELYDVNVEGSCDRMSIGLRASASRCPGASAPRFYRLTTLHVPTRTEISNGATAGHDLDGVGTVCSFGDYPGQVDNGLVDVVAEAFPAFDSNIQFQTDIDAALGCAVSGATCTRQDIFVSVATGDECAVVAITNSVGNQLATRVGSLASGELRVRLPSWNLSIPIVHNTQLNYANARLEGVILTADVTASTLSNVVIGGTAPSAEFGSFVEQLLTAYDSTTDFDDIAAIIANLNDVRYFGTCGALSMGFTGAGTAVP